MKASQLLLASMVVVGLSALGEQSASAQTDMYINAGDTDRFKLYSPVDKDVFVEDNREVLLDSHTGAVYTRIGSGGRWTQYAEGHDIRVFPTGGEWDAPRFELAIVSSNGGTAKLLLTNTSSGASYTRTPSSGRWSPYRRSGSR